MPRGKLCRISAEGGWTRPLPPGARSGPGRLVHESSSKGQTPGTSIWPFKGKSAEEIYDILMEQLLKAIRKYNPDYSDQTRELVRTINEKLSRFKQFTLADVNRHLEFDALGHLRNLVRRGQLATFTGPNGRIAGYRRASWPPD